MMKAGSRNSILAVRQAQFSIKKLGDFFPNLKIELHEYSSPGDRDRKTDLEHSPADFFVRDLDDAVLDGSLDCAIHSAKDMIYPIREGLDWFWLPWHEEPQDVLVLRTGKKVNELKESDNITCGVSSDRRREYCKKCFPQGVIKSIRGNIEDRLKQLDNGKYDVIIMAKAALVRLGLQERISEEIPLADLNTPEGQGRLGISFRTGDKRFQLMRNFFLKPLVFAGSGPGAAEHCTIAGRNALERADVCLYDALADSALLQYVPGKSIYVGKRSGIKENTQEEINRLLRYYSRTGLRTVRLKGGDPGIFGRLKEETDALDDLRLHYRVLPGVTSLNAATTATGMLLTQRNQAHGFTVLSSRKAGGGMTDIGKEARSKFPLAFYMSISNIEDVVSALYADGHGPDEPAAVVFNAGGAAPKILRGTLNTIAGLVHENSGNVPGLLLIGNFTRTGYSTTPAPLEGETVLLTCSKRVMEKAITEVQDFGGLPYPFSLIELESEEPDLRKLFGSPRAGSRLPASFDWLILTSPTSVRIFMKAMQKQQLDIRSLPSIMVTGELTAAEFRQFGVHADLFPDKDYSASSLIELAGKHLSPGSRVLRLRSDKAGDFVRNELMKLGMNVTDEVLYRNVQKLPNAGNIPAADDFTSVFFASSSAVESFLQVYSIQTLKKKKIVSIGSSTTKYLHSYGIQNLIEGQESSVVGAICTFALINTRERLKDLV